MRYLQSGGGYFYKEYKNGDKKRISKKEYKKKISGGGVPRKLDIKFGIVTHQTIGDCIKELINASYNIYDSLLLKRIPTTIVCGGQSPSYYCLAMMNFSIFNPELVDIVILPHSKGGVNSNNQIQEDILYCERLREKSINLNNNVVIIDGVHSGTGILALESALKHCFPSINIIKIAINARVGISKIKVNEEYILPCEPKFSDTFPRLVTSFHPSNFSNSSKFITEFINLESNPIAEMIIDIARTYPQIPVEETEWYKLNNEIISEIAKKKNEKRRINEEFKNIMNKIPHNEQLKMDKGYFTPIVLNNPKRYKCPICGYVTGTHAPENPHNKNLFSHYFNCPNKNKIPQEITNQ